MARPLQLKIPVIAVTGSAGKTTTKEMIFSILSQRWKVLKTYGNANMARHTQKKVEQLRPFHRAMVLEFGMLHAGGIRKHCSIIQPKFSIVTNIGTAHIGNFKGNIDGIARAKSELIRYMNPRGKLFINLDDPNVYRLRTKNFKGRIITTSQYKPANYQATKVTYTSKGLAFNIKLRGQITSMLIPAFGKHNVNNALLAIAVADQLGFSPLEIQKGLQSYSRLRGRLNIYSLKNNIKVIDDSYSANPSAMKAAIDVLSDLGHKTTNVAILGSMLEQGSYSVKGHREVGRHLAKKRNIHLLFTLGKEAKQIVIGAVNAGYPKENAKHFSTREELHRTLKQKMNPNSTILVKGSHGIYMNRTVNYLRGKNKEPQLNK